MKYYLIKSNNKYFVHFANIKNETVFSDVHGAHWFEDYMYNTKEGEKLEEARFKLQEKGFSTTIEVLEINNYPL